MARTVRTRADRSRDWEGLSANPGLWYSSRWGGISTPMITHRMPLGRFFAVIYDPDMSEEDRAGLHKRMRAASRAHGWTPVAAVAVAVVVAIAVVSRVGPIPGVPSPAGPLLVVGITGVATWLGITQWCRRAGAVPDYAKRRVIVDSAPLRIPRGKAVVLLSDFVDSDVVIAADRLGEFENRVGVEDDDFDREWRRVWKELTAAQQWAATPAETPQRPTLDGGARQQPPGHLN